MLYAVLTALLFALSFLAGMLGLGVAFIATPVLGLFGYELKHVIMPWSLMLNGLTAIAGAVTFARAGMVDWRTAVPLLIITTLAAPAGVWLLQFVPTNIVWWIYVGVLFFLAYRMAFPPKMDDSRAPVITDGTRLKGGLLSAAIGVFAGFLGGLLGVGGGNFIVPVLSWLGLDAKIAAGTTALVVVFSSFSGFLGHASLGGLDPLFLALTAGAAAAGSILGSQLMKDRLSSAQLKPLIGALLWIIAVKMLFDLL